MIYAQIKQEMILIIYQLINSLAKMAEERGHHPDLVVGYCKVFVEFTSHDLGGVSEECMNMAKYIDSITTAAD